MTRTIAIAAAVLIAGSAAADEIEDSLEAALEAYRAGDLRLAQEEIDFAATLIAERKAKGLGAFLPPAQPGWTREDVSDTAQGIAAFGGGVMATARYDGPGGSFEVQIMADNQFVASMGAMLTNPAMMGSLGRVHRVDRQTYLVTQQGEVQALVAGRVMVQISGTAPVEAKRAHFEAIDFKALAEF